MNTNNLTDNSKIMVGFLSILNQIKLYHWQTKSYARHKATDELHSQLSSLVDEFIEVLQGKNILDKKETRIMLKNKQPVNLFDVNEQRGELLLIEIRGFINGITTDSADLENIRADMLTLINKTGYLFTLE